MSTATARLLLVVVLGLPAASARAEEPTQVVEDELAAGGLEYVLVPFEVPAGTVELEVRHERLDADDVLDYGLLGPAGFRGWGGGNREPIVVGATAASRSYLPGALEPGTWHVIVGKALVKDEAARYRLELFLRTTATLAADPARSPYRPGAALSTEARWYAGDLHVHSRESGDAEATLEQIATLAEARGLDFVEISDHNTFAQVDLLADVQARHPHLLFIPGVELTTYHGHANGIGATAWIDHRVEVDGRTMSDVAVDVRAQGALFSVNHPAIDLGDLCIGCKFTHVVAPGLIDAVEIGTGGWNEGGYLFGERAIAFWDALCARGAHVAAVGGSDDHTAGLGTGPFKSSIGSPTTMVWASELSAAAIVAGIRSRRTVVKLEAPTDPMITLAATAPIDGDAITAQHTELRATVTGGNGTLVRWVKNGSAVATATVTADPFTLPLELDAPATGADRLRAEVWIDGAPRTVTSHLWLAAPEAGCSCRTDGAPHSSSGLGPAALLVLLALAASRRRAPVT